MHRMFRPAALVAPAILLFSSFALLSQTVTRGTAVLRAPLLRQRIDESRLATLSGNVRPEANTENDVDAVSDDRALNHMMLQLQRSPQQEREVEALIAELHNPRSSHFHQWLTAAEFGGKYGLADSDIQAVTRWLESYGFTVNSVYPSRMVIDFSGSAGQVRHAFHTTLHNLRVNGEQHIANFSDPKIPAALAPAVAGILSLHDFRPHKMSIPKYTFTSQGLTIWPIVPADLATIYDFNPLFTGGITGTGQTIAVIEDTNLYTDQDFSDFRAKFGLTQYSSGSFSTMHPAAPTGTNNCADPGVNEDDVEAILDAEWATAAAPGAAILLASCGATTYLTSGVMITLQNLINGTKPPGILSLSYGVCEAYNGAALNAALNSIYQQAVAEGISVFVASGDEGAASCDAGLTNATHGIGVSGFASTQYDVAVGGTDFGDTVNSTNDTYWSKTNSATYGSALSYIPEIPWDDSCANEQLATFLGFSTSYGADGLCASTMAQQFGLLTVAAGSGGPSGCFTGAAATVGIVSGSCKGYAKPSWQTGITGIPNDGVRDIPDVSMFAANGIWGHYAIICFSDPDNGGVPCTGAPSGWAGVGGTSLATPIMAGIQALVNQHLGGNQGNPNPVYYTLAAGNSTVFHTVTQGDIDVNCGGTYNCFGSLGTPDYGRNGRIFGTTFGGALSVSNGTFTPAYGTGASGWNFATGLGSVDANNLVMNWPKK